MEVQNVPELISIVIPFYKGNRYLDELLTNLESVAAAVQTFNGMKMEVIIVNDSPEIPVAYTKQVSIPVTVVDNAQNMGIHGSRVHGIRCAKGAWIQMLDQDDLLIPENYPLQLQHMQSCDVTVGNCEYYFGQVKRCLYPNGKVMQYYIGEERLLQVRNLIASPGHCLIRKSAIPAWWMENIMHVNGSDDYYLWMLMFHDGARFALNEKPVYIHRNSEEGNLSFDLEKMHRSNCEMCQLLETAPFYPRNKLEKLQRSIRFKYLYDTKKLKRMDWLHYADKVLDNGIYKAWTHVLRALQ